MAPASNLLALAATVLALASPAVGQLGKSGTSSSSGERTTSNSSNNCVIRVNASADKQDAEARAKAVAELDSFVCSSKAEDAIEQRAEVVAEAVSEAYAKAVANSVIFCDQSGTTSASISAKGKAETEAKAFSEAISQVFAVSEVCDKCIAVVEAVTSAFEEVHLEAAAESLAVLEATTNGDAVETRVENFVEVVVNKTARAFAEAIVDTSAAPDAGCEASGSSKAVGGESVSQCELFAGSIDDNIEVDSVAEVAQDLAIVACGEDGEADAEVVADQAAIAIARAVAQSISEIFIECSSEGEGKACALAETEISTVARAQASAFVRFYADSIGCDCEVNVGGTIAAFQEVIVDASTSAFQDISCTDDTIKDFDVELFSEATAELSVKAVAKIITEATAGPECALITEASAVTCVTLDCVRSNRVCSEVGSEEIAPCCDNDFHCVRRSEDRDATCRRKAISLRSGHVVLEPTCDPEFA